ncbi:MAG: adenosylmethionine decarboxylase [Spongiibacteraceae bacterium]|nr:adenosylmethionine decarboxylase [Spongiibacteraceae bacterium]MBN4055214.1 adenosylmethionine decarboxylase [bacterium AH-315-K03]
MKTKSQHLLVELFDCNVETLKDQSLLTALLNQAAVAANVTIVQSVFHQFSPQGVTGVVIIEESHLSIHTWPEYAYASVDFYTCGDGLPEKAFAVIAAGLEAQRSELLMIDRGQSLTDLAMLSRYHKVQGTEEIA